MNRFLASRYSEEIARGALGLELWDPLRNERLMRPIAVALERPAAPVPVLEPFPVRSLRLHSLFYGPGLGSSIDVRLDDPNRVQVPRRLRFPIPAPDPDNGAQPALRVRRADLFPGAAYPWGSGATGLRGRVMRGGQPARWVRIEARRDGTALVIGRAQGDDRGEFLLILGTDPSAIGDLELTLAVELSLFAPPVPMPAVFAEDPLGDLAVEVVGPPAAAPDAVALGQTLPAGYALIAQPTVDLTLGRIATRTFLV